MSILLSQKSKEAAARITDQPKRCECVLRNGQIECSTFIGELVILSSAA